MSIKIISTLCLIAISSQGCGKSVSSFNSSAASPPSITTLEWFQNSGPVSPQYWYARTYKVDFQTQSLEVTTTQGHLSHSPQHPSTTLNRTLNDDQLERIQTLFYNIAQSDCSGQALVGGGANQVKISTSSSSRSILIYHHCSKEKAAQNSFQASKTEYKALTAYIESIGPQ